MSGTLPLWGYTYNEQNVPMAKCKNGYKNIIVTWQLTIFFDDILHTTKFFVEK